MTLYEENHKTYILCQKPYAMLRKIATVIAYAGFIAGSLFLGTVTSLFLFV